MSRLKCFSVIAVCFLMTSVNSSVFPCTTFVLRYQNHLYFGRNLDWISGTGLIMTNQKNLEKTALVDSAENPVRWVSKYGSITFNQVGKDLPYGGINEAGLVVEHMTLDKTIYPAADNRQAVQPCQWIQYQLDNCATVEEVINNDKVLRITRSTSKFHFLICDSRGHTAVIEFLDGKMVCHTGKDLALEALANSTFDESLQCVTDYKKTGLPGPLLSDRSLLNFATAAKMISIGDTSVNNTPVDYAFNILKSVSQSVGTKWSIVYDITEMKVYVKVFETPVIAGPNKIFRKTPGVSSTKVIDVRAFNFDCAHSGKVLDLEFEAEGPVNNHFINYTTEINKKFIVQAFTFFKAWEGNAPALNEEQMNYLAHYPESFKCK